MVKKYWTGVACLMIIVLFTGCSSTLNLGSGDLSVTVKPGEDWNHKLPVFLFFSIKTQPQFAIWVDYIDTIYVTHKTATQGWSKAPGDPTPKDKITRNEALPYWSHKRNILGTNGSYMPSRDKPVEDAKTSATPKKESTFGYNPANLPDKFLVVAEFNISTDFNDTYRKDLAKEDENYSGGEWRSGQPSIIYEAQVDKNSTGIVKMKITGHGSPDGSNGNLYSDMSGMTTAMKIVGDITVKVK